MATEHHEHRPARSDLNIVERMPGRRPGESRSFGELLKDLASDTGQLVRDEVTLAKNELRQTASAVMRDSLVVAIGAGLAVAGGLSLLAGIIVLLGDAVFGDNYWVPALLVGAVLVLIGGIMAYSKSKSIARDADMDATVDSLKEDARWAKSEVRDFRDELREDSERRRHAA